MISWCSSEDFKFAELPLLRRDLVNIAVKIDDFFTGQHEKILLKAPDNPKSVLLGGDKNAAKIKNFT